MSPLISSNCDLSDAQNRTQARHELNRALDQGDAQGLAAWAQKWGEAALEVADEHQEAPEQEWWDGPDADVSLATLTSAKKEIGRMLEQATAIVALSQQLQAIGKSASDSLTAEIENIEDAA